jgi:hypothetical protein
MKNISIQLPSETRRQIAQLAACWGEPEQRHNTPVIARCVERAHAAELLKRDGYDTNVVSRKVFDDQVNPEITIIEGRNHVHLGSGLLAEVAARIVDAEDSDDGGIVRIGDDVYYYNAAMAPGYERLLAVVMLRMK